MKEFLIAAIWVATFVAGTVLGLISNEKSWIKDCTALGAHVETNKVVYDCRPRPTPTKGPTP
jgi:hypothetical protein